jgi:hypothetical protein
LVVADHENKPDIASGIARKWFDADKVDMIANLIDSGSEYILQSPHWRAQAERSGRVPLRS